MNQEHFKKTSTMSRNKPFYIIGAGGHAKVVIASTCSLQNIVGIFDHDENKLGKTFFEGLKITSMPSLSWWNEHKPRTITALGNNFQRKKIVEELGQQKWINVIHSSAIVHHSAKVGAGVYVGANVVIQPDAVIGDHAIINTACVIEHDVKIGAYSHVAPGSILTGHAEVGEGTLLGTGTRVIPCKKIGSWVVIGAGSVIVSNIPSHTKSMGVPCRVISDL